MYDIAEQVARWLAEGRSVRVAQVVATRGFSSRDPAAALAWTDGAEVGVLVPGATLALPERAGLVDVTVSDAQAAGAGLSCGGVARVVVQDAAAVPSVLWRRLARREPVCVVHVLAEGVRTEVYTAADVRDATQWAGEIPRLFARGTSATALIEDSVAVATFWPPTHLLVVGGGAIAAALADAATLLGWMSAATEDVAEVEAASLALTESDAVVVLSHDRAVDVPALAAVLAGRAGYVGALGSRHTQSARREGLAGRGTSEQALARIHGPAGLDIDAHTPAEIAVSIVAEVLAARSGSSGGSIGDRGGPVHTAGVHAPPPRV
jgi:xanthine dehydrogenase accessory factor